MRAGELREDITIQRPTTVADAIGGLTEGTPTVIATNIPAAVEPVGIGQERIQIAQLRTSVSKRVRIRWRDDVTVAMQILWDGRVLEIGAIEEPPRRTELHLYCAEVQ